VLLHDILGHAAHRTPDAPALIAGGRTTTFAELDDRARRLAAVLTRHAGRGDRVAVVADNCAAWVECYYGISYAGAVLMPLNQRLTPGEQAIILAAAEPTVLIGERHRLEALAPLAGDFPSVHTVAALDEDRWDAMLAAVDPLDPIVGQEADEPAWLLFTSGTTGRPKGVVLSHTALVTAVIGTALARPAVGEDVFLTAFPLCHVAGYNVVVFHLHGRPTVILPRFRADELVAAIRAHGVTVTSLAPTMLRSLLDHLGDGAELPSLRLVTYGASPMAPELLREATTRLGVILSEGYGMTELAGNAVCDGRPNPLVSIRVVDDALVDVEPGAVGEIVVRGDQVTSGYWRDPASTAEAFVGGWFHTGDLGTWDVDGRLRIVDRRKDIIVTGGENVASREVEDVLHDHPGVAAVAVVGVPDEYWGEAICAVVVPRPGAEVALDELVTLARTRLAGFKQPRHVVLVDALPVNAAGKVLKAELRRLATDHLAG
jgi:acyl-CoA synthetase (AMP-forming)/AMP-acid ligase II